MRFNLDKLVTAWSPNTSYKKNQWVITPSGVLAQAKENNQSGSFDPTKWNVDAASGPGPLIHFAVSVTVPGGNGNNKAMTMTGALPDGWTQGVAHDSTPDANLVPPPGLYNVMLSVFPNVDIETGAMVQASISAAGFSRTSDLTDAGSWDTYNNVDAFGVPITVDDDPSTSGIEVSLTVYSTGDIGWAGDLYIQRVSDLPA